MDFKVQFSKVLVPTIEGYDGRNDNDWWTFEIPVSAKSKSLDQSSSRFNELGTHSSTSVMQEVTDVDSNYMASNSSDQSVPSSSHSNMASLAIDCDSSLTDVDSVLNTSTPSVHKNPNWLKELKSNFYAEIIDPCSARTKSAVQSDKYIKVSVFFINFVIFLMIFYHLNRTTENLKVSKMR